MRKPVAANAFDLKRRHKGLVEAIKCVNDLGHYLLVLFAGKQKDALAPQVEKRIDVMLRLLLARKPNTSTGVGSIDAGTDRQARVAPGALHEPVAACHAWTNGTPSV